MRPVRRGANPISGDFSDYKKAKPELVSRIGSGWFNGIHVASYCSYCERRFETNLAVEHIQPKGLKVGSIKPYAHLVGTWTNFLLACVNCNSTKKDKDVVLSEVLLPDRDNTFIAYEYLKDGTINITAPSRHLYNCAEETLKMVGLDKAAIHTADANGRTIALERVFQRMNAWLYISDSKQTIDSEPNSEATRKATVRFALATGFFSIWIKVFEDDADMRNRLIDAFAGTRESGCFDSVTTAVITPAPNPDGLAHGGKL
jgi:hypothetical protein